MKDKRGVITCNVCGRQIVSRKCSEKDIVGSITEAIRTNINVHICGECKQDPIVREQEGLEEIK